MQRDATQTFTESSVSQLFLNSDIIIVFKSYFSSFYDAKHTSKSQAFCLVCTKYKSTIFIMFVGREGEERCQVNVVKAVEIISLVEE